MKRIVLAALFLFGCDQPTPIMRHELAHCNGWVHANVANSAYLSIPKVYDHQPSIPVAVAHLRRDDPGYKRLCPMAGELACTLLTPRYCAVFMGDM